MTSPILSIDDLTVRLPTPTGVVHAVSDLSLTVRRGEFIGIVGESGCGKTTLALAVLRLLNESAMVSGRIVLDGVEVLGASTEQLLRLRRGVVAFIPQDPLASLDPTFSVGAQIVETIRAHDRHVSRRAARTRAVQLMESVGIVDAAGRFDAAPHTFSGGMRQRVAIAIAIANEPALIVADEPTTALDVTVQRQVLELLRALSTQTGTAICMITHDLAVAADVCDRLVVLYAGKIVEEGPVGDVLSTPRHPYTRALIDAIPRPGVPRGQLAVIPGELPDPQAPPSGCRFAGRCVHRMEQCADEPPLMAVGESCRAACWLVSDR